MRIWKPDPVFCQSSVPIGVQVMVTSAFLEVVQSRFRVSIDVDALQSLSLKHAFARETSNVVSMVHQVIFFNPKIWSAKSSNSLQCARSTWSSLAISAQF